MKNSNTKHTVTFLSIAFIEGAAVMACELLGAKMTAPFFGTTIYSWAAVLAITLGALAAGYYFGGWASTKQKPEKLIDYILIATGIFMVFMPVIASATMKMVIDFSLVTGLILSLMIFLFPPVFLFGMVSPVIISALVKKVDVSGKTAGKVYAISTIGGVINTLLLGFYIIPTFGIKWPSVVYGIILLITALAFIASKKKVFKAVALLLLVIISINIQSEDLDKNTRQLFKIKYSSEGLLGQIKVADYSIKTDSFGVMPMRGLLVNNTWQTVINKNDGIGMLDYIYFIRPLLSSFDQGADVLLIGLGGGTLCNEIQKKGLNVEVVELDGRLPEIAMKYFGMSRKTKVTTDDGRHFLQTADKKYDLIIFDAFLGENPPWHLLTLESFDKVKSLLKEDGKFIIEFYGILNGTEGMATRSVYASLNEVGFKTDVVATSHEDGIDRNFVYVCGNEDFDYNKLDYSGTKYTDKDISNLRDYLIPADSLLGQDYTLLTDDLPVLEEMLMKPALQWRKQLNTHFRNKLIAVGQPIFY